MAASTSELNVSVDEPQAWARRLHITVPADRIERERQDVARHVAQGVSLPGFRKGKVPTRVIEQRYGATIDQQTIERVVGEAYREAVQREGFEPITQASVENVDYSRGSDLSFDAEFEVRPEIELERLGGFKLTQTKPEITDDEVERVLARVREEQATWHPVKDSPPEPGDKAVLEMTPLTAEEGEPAESAPRRYEIVLGRDEALPDVEAALQSLEPGAEGEFTIAVPAEDGEEEHRVRIRLVEAEHAELPELDDELARSVGDFEDVEQLRAAVRADLERQAERETERDLRRELMDQVIAANPFEVPQAMVDNYLEQVLQSREDMDPSELEEMRQAARPSAERAIKRILVIERVAEAHDMQATKEEVDARVEALAERHDRSPSEIWTELQRSGRLRALEDEITEEKVFEFLKSKSAME